MAPRNPVRDDADRLGREMIPITDNLVIHFRKYQAQGYPVEEALERAFEVTGFESKVSALVATAATEVLLERTGIEVTSKVALRKWYLDRAWKGTNLTLSSQVHKTTRDTIDQLSRTIRLRLRLADDWASTARRIQAVGVTSGELPAYMKRLLDSARKSLDDPKAFAEYRKAVRAAERQISNMAETGVSGNRLQKAYRNLIDKSTTLNETQLTKSVDRAIRAKSFSNATRVSRTEIARAYGIAQGEQINSDEDAVGVRWELSSAHQVEDICDVNEGVYPKDQVPVFPSHPGCTCVLSPEYNRSKATDRFSNSRQINKLKNMSNAKQEKLMGKRGAAEFRQDPNTWQSNLRNWQGVQPLAPENPIPDYLRK